MTKLLEKAISTIRKLSDDRQDELAEIIIELAQPRAEYELTDEQLADVELAKREAREGKFATKEEMADLWRRFRE